MGMYYREQLANAPIDLLPERWLRHPFVARLQQFASPTRSDLHSLWRLIESEVTVKKRRDLVIDGYEYRKLCFVEDGFAARYKLLRNGKRQIIDFVLPGDVIGLSGSFVEKARYSVVAVTDLKLQICPINDYVQLCYERPQFGLNLSWLAMHEAIICAEHTISTGRRTPSERIIHFLLEIHSRLAMVGRASESSFVLPFSQEIMSDALGLSVPHLNRSLVELRAEGLIAMDGRTVELIDRDNLEFVSHFQPVNLMRIPRASHFARDS
jgi:CRP-like cAMP-binding protein